MLCCRAFYFHFQVFGIDHETCATLHEGSALRCLVNKAFAHDRSLDELRFTAASSRELQIRMAAFIPLSLFILLSSSLTLVILHWRYRNDSHHSPVELTHLLFATDLIAVVTTLAVSCYIPDLGYGYISCALALQQ